MKTASFLPLLCLIFITLKLCSVIAWSWWWVLAPMWMPFALLILIGLLVIIGSICIGTSGKR